MEFKRTDLNNASEEELLKVLNYNARCATFIKQEIDKLKQATTSSNSKVSVITKHLEEVKVKREEVEDKAFEEKVKKHLKDVKALDLNDIEENIYGVLPIHRDYRYEKIIRRVILELKKEIDDINAIIVEEGEDISKSDFEELTTDIKNYFKRIEVLRDVLKEEKSEDVDDNIDNTLVFIPTQSGNPRLLDDLDNNIPSSFYDEFLELFNSIKDGSFKGAKRFNKNRKLSELREVKGNHLRITYFKLGKNTYGILTAFIKKTNTSHGYRNMLETRYKDYKNGVESKIKENLNNEEFLQLQKDYEIEVLRKLGIEEEIAIQKVKKGND